MVELANSNPADRSDRGTALTPLAEVAAAPWRELAARAVEPNAYYLPEWARAVNASPRARAATLALTAFDDACAMIGLVPVISAWRAYRLPLPALVSADPFRSLDTPLLDRDAADRAAHGLIDQARKAGAHGLLLRLTPLDGTAAKAFLRVTAERGLRPRILNSYARACLDATREPEALLRDALGPKKLKELRRLRNRLGEHGEVIFAAARDADAVARSFDIFLTLEMSGWKAQRGTALAQRGEDAERLRRAAVALAARGQCEVVTLHAGSTPVAAGIVLRHLDRAFFFKIGIDQRFAKFSPGVQLTLGLTRHLCNDPAIASADSTAASDHPMIDPIWRGRLPIGDLLIPLRRYDPLVPVIELALRAYAALRLMALRVLRR